MADDDTPETYNIGLTYDVTSQIDTNMLPIFTKNTH